MDADYIMMICYDVMDVVYIMIICYDVLMLFYDDVWMMYGCMMYMYDDVITYMVNDMMCMK